MARWGSRAVTATCPDAASPVYADGRLYFFNQEGVTTVLKPGRTFEIADADRLFTAAVRRRRL